MTDVRSMWMALALCGVIALSVSAQDDPQQHHEHQTASSTWTWATDANIFVGYNYQQRLFADFSTWESQNWFMGSAAHPVGRGRLTIASMLSLEPFTM